MYITNDRNIPTKTHSLVPLFDELDSNDASVLSEYYRDFKIHSSNPNIRSFPFVDLRAFLTNLDGKQNDMGKFIGSLDWRYFLIEETPPDRMPLVSIDCMHEVVFGSIRIIEHAINGRFDPSKYVLSRRLLRARCNDIYFEWLTVRMNSNEWPVRADTIEILWGPDAQGRCDLLFTKHLKIAFEEVPQNSILPIVDRRQEIKEFDPKEGLKSVGIRRGAGFC